MEDSAVRLQDNLRSLDATEDIHALHTDPSLTSRSNRDFEAAAAVAAANAASGSQPFDALPAATAAVANNLHPSTVTSQDGESFFTSATPLSTNALLENPATPQSLRRPHQQQQQLTQAHHQHQLHPPSNSNGFLEHTNSGTVDMLDHLQTSLPPHLLNQFHDATPPMGGGESPLSPAINKGEPYFKNMKLISNPPDLKRWRERLFNVEDTIVLSEEEFQTYFPHIDNVYSHRSTQKYKRKLFVSHYWDCRLKGRPPGTPKSRDPNKKKRKRTARERDLCDVKIKITEYLPGALTTPPGLGPSLLSINSPSLTTTTAASSDMQPATSIGFPGSADQSNGARPHVAGHHPQSQSQSQLQYPFGVLAPSATLPEGHPGAAGARYYTIQRVNGNGGNGRTDGIGGPHRHTLEESDRIKKNSVQRYLLKEEKERKRIMVQQKTYHKKASGSAAVTVKKHAKEADLKLFGSCFCPFVQRVWIALEVKGIPYQYIEIDPYKKPESLLEVNPRGLVPAIRQGNWGCYESTVLLEYLDELEASNPLLPPRDPQLRAHCRLWADHVNRHIIPTFYRLLQEQDGQKQITHSEELKAEINKLVNASHVHGPFFLGPTISFVDIQFAPWMLRLSRVLKPYRGWPDPERGSRWEAWVDAVEGDEHVRATTSSDELYLDSYERYAGELCVRIVVA
ncbi:conserved hypothetical protein [Histoplasma capsulatum G186AR]|uniref:Glutathione transferase n=1 Tax=Ajellomyces capsulatus (strain G186AR / H82 / ATCC MYA-2454 / RMSCC 2432) TaxID=447093 RepID=C0NJP4_AJECG|nr:uncharacterized protein HCBG_03374 [Histoplasma capsulatum G186AR]EEH08085.1 conserved hypothetical protein [Histoplasma capsulatum G186AR]